MKPGIPADAGGSSALSTLSAVARVFCGLICVAILLLFVREIVSPTRDGLFTAISLGEALVASAVMFYFSFQRSIVHLLTSVYISVWYTLRVFVLYFVPERLENAQFTIFTPADVEVAARYLMLVCIALLMASIVEAVLFPGSRAKWSGPFAIPRKISFFGLTVDFESFLRWALWFTLIAALFRVYAFASGLGIRVSVVYQPEEYLLRVFQNLSFPFYLLGVFALCATRDRLARRLAWTLVILIIADGILSTSRGWLFGLIVKYAISALVLNLTIRTRTKMLALAMIPVGLLVLFPAMTALRPILASGEGFSGSRYAEELRGNVSSSLDVFLYSLDRFSGFDWLVLWANVDPTLIPPNVSLYGEVVDLVNKFVPGELIVIPGSIQLNKLQAVLSGSRTIEFLDELGGHGEVAGGIATLHIFFGALPGLTAAALWLFGCLRLEQSRLHPLHRAYFYQVYVQDFIIGGGYLIIPSSFFWYLVVSAVIAFTLRFLGAQSVSPVPLRPGRSIRPRTTKVTRPVPST